MADIFKDFRKIRQIGVVVKNIDEAVANVTKLLGVEPSGSGETPPGDKRFHGVPEDFSAKLVFFEFDNIQLELIQPMRGKSVWQEYVDKHGGGIHHILFFVNSFDGVRDHMAKHGAELLQDGPSVNYPGARWGYFGTEDQIGFQVEINNPLEKGYDA